MPLYNKVKESKTRLHVAFSKSTVNLKIGISHISINQARKNIPACGFDAQLKNVRKTWNEKLRKIEIAGTEKQKRMFYTALYHTMLMPVDKSGETLISPLCLIMTITMPSGILTVLPCLCLP